MITVSVIVPIVTVLISLVAGAASAQPHWPGWLDYLRVHSWWTLSALTVLSAGLAFLATSPQGSEVELSAAAGQLATAVRRDSENEAKWRKIFDPYPLEVTWRPADPDLMVPWANVVALGESRPAGPVNRDTWALSPVGLAGGREGLAGVLRRVPTGRLVVLGDKGAGKTILLLRLILDLLPRPDPDDASVAGPPSGPVPILMPVASWDPTEQDLEDWMVNWLTTERAGLAGLARAGRRVTLARALLEQGKILPVLDGLDEIPLRVRGEAIAKINEWMTSDQRLVLAARTDDYRATALPMQGAAALLTGAAGIQVQPLPVDVITSYLRASAVGAAAQKRWDPVIDAFAADDPPPAAAVLTTPLMASLARVAYNPRPGEDIAEIPMHPEELLDQARFPDREAIEDYLFDRFVPSSYRRHPDPSHPSRRYHWTLEQAQRWLIFLADSQEHRQNGSTDIAWWKLRVAAPARLPGITLGIAVAIAFAVGYPFPGFGIGLIAAIPVGLACRRWVRIGRDGLGRGVAGGLIGGIVGSGVALALLGAGSVYLLFRILTGGLALGISMSAMNRIAAALPAAITAEITTALYENSPRLAALRASIGPSYHAINALGAWLIALLFVEITGRNVPARGIRWSLTWFGSGLMTSVVLGAVTWIQVSRLAGIVVGVAAVGASAVVADVSESVESDLTGAASPDTVLRRDRTTFIASGLGLGGALGFAIGLVQSLAHSPAGRPNGPAYGAQIGATTFIIVGLVFGFVQATWGPFAVSRCYLAASGRLPWRLMTFLHDAHANRGVLRQVGAVYQFRHIELQRRLAGPPPPGSDSMAQGQARSGPGSEI